MGSVTTRSDDKTADVGKVLVTGGAGYIGSHAVKILRSANLDVVVYDNLSAGHRASIGNTTFVEGDIRNTETVRAVLREHAVTDVMHFAGLLSVGESVRDPARYYDQNVGGALSVLDAMVAEQVDRFVLSSTCAVYGHPITTPIDEEQPTFPINAYGDTKLAVERALRHYDRAYGLRSMSLRYFNAAGADPEGMLGEDHSPEIHLIPRAIASALGGPPLVVFGDDYPTSDGTCERDFVHVNDLADAHLRAMEALRGGANTRVYNLGTGQAHSVRDVVRTVERVTGHRVPTEVAARRPGDPAVLFAQANRIAQDLDWRPVYDNLDEIVETAWRWYQSHPLGFSE